MKCRKHPDTDYEVVSAGKKGQLRVARCPRCAAEKGKGKPAPAPSPTPAPKPTPKPEEKKRRGFFF